MKIFKVGILSIFLSGCQSISTESETINKTYQGKASWYSSGKKTASGQKFNPNGFSVAHRTLPFGTIVQLTNPQNGNKVTAVVNDRGPFVKHREIDVSRGVARSLGFIDKGTERLIIEVYNRPLKKEK